MNHGYTMYVIFLCFCVLKAYNSQALHEFGCIGIAIYKLHYNFNRLESSTSNLH